MALTVPSYQEKAFNCPHCGAYAHQTWEPLLAPGPVLIRELDRAICAHCSRYSVWLRGQMIYPENIGVAPPNGDMREDIREDYLEASSIVNKSPRGAAALLRLCIQKLCTQLGEGGKNVNADIASLVKKGLSPKIQQALDIVRVIGNNAVHPGQIDLKDDSETALRLFELVNLITDTMITQPKQIEQLYGSLPEDQRKQIEGRDKDKGIGTRG
jgi:hypothetical protein